MRHYDRADYRHLNDADRYRDYEYLADDQWSAARERPARGVDAASAAPEPASPRRGKPAPRRGARAVLDRLLHPRETARHLLRDALRGAGPVYGARPDERLYEDVCRVLAEHPAIDASRLEVAVEQGEVTLTGVVPDARTRRLAGEVLESLLGVRDVRNRVRVAAR